MNKQENEESRYFIRWETHSKCMTSVLCSLMEHQSLVDVAICCGTNTIHAHKCVLAANSQYFREQLEKNLGTEQIIITGLDFVIVKSIIEYIYCGVTQIFKKNLKYTIAAAKFFQLRGLEVLVSDQPSLRYETDLIQIQPPIFLTKKPKYPNSYRPPNASTSENFNTFKNPIGNDAYTQRKIKRKFVRTEAEKACAKEAAASRLALEALQREIASTPQVSSFVIEESCTETTVENFIPHSEEAYIENLDQMDNVSQLQVVNFDDLNNSFVDNQMMNLSKTDTVNNMLQFDVPQNSTKDKIKHILGTDIPGNVEIMFRTSDGNFVNVTDDVLQNLSGGSLQYQIVDENGQVGEIRDLNVQDQYPPNFEEVPPLALNNISRETANEFISSDVRKEGSLQNVPQEVDKSDPDYVVSSETSSAGSKTSSNVSTSSESKLDEADDTFINALRNCDTNNTVDLYHESIFDGCNDLLASKDVAENKEHSLGREKIDTSRSVDKFGNVPYMSDSNIDCIIDVTSDVNDEDYYLEVKKRLLSHSPRKTRSRFSFNAPEEISIENLDDLSSVSDDGQLSDVKTNKPRRIMSAHKKK